MSRVHEELSRQARNAVSDEIGAQSSQNLVSKMRSILLVEILRKELRQDEVRGVGSAEADVRHDGNQHVLFLVELSWIQAVARSEEGKLPRRHDGLPGLASREGKQLRDVGFEHNRRLADVEDLIDEDTRGDVDDADGPGTDRGAGHRGVVCVVHHLRGQFMLRRPRRNSHHLPLALPGKGCRS